MKNLFEFSDYKDFLKELLHSKSAPRGLQSRLAQHLQCQSSYIYQVLKAKGELTEDQGFRVTTFLNMSENQRNYFMTLLRLAKAASPELKAFLKMDAARMLDIETELHQRADALKPEANEQIWQYYFSSAIPSAIHLLTSAKAFQTEAALSRKLRMPIKLVREHLLQLEELKFVTCKNGVWKHASPSLHFEKESKHNRALQLMRRSQVMSALAMPLQEDAVHYTSLFTLDKKSFEALKIQIAQFVQKSQKTIHAGGTDELYLLNLDLLAPFQVDSQ